MEGSRHEHALLVVLGYLVGAVTVFIGAQNTTIQRFDDSSTNVGNVNQTASLALSQPETTLEEPVPEVKQIASYSEGRLEVKNSDLQKVISFQINPTDQPPSEFVDQGYHVGQLVFKASPTQEYIFFCEQKTVTDETCVPFVYDVISDVIYPLRLDGERVALLNSAASAATWEGNILGVGGKVSDDSLRPWLLR